MATLTDYLTVSQAAAQIGVDESQVRRYLRDGLLAYHEVSPRVRLILRRDVDKFRRPPRPGRPRRKR